MSGCHLASCKMSLQHPKRLWIKLQTSWMKGIMRGKDHSHNVTQLTKNQSSKKQHKVLLYGGLSTGLVCEKFSENFIYFAWFKNSLRIYFLRN